jgi:NTE family protein
LARRLLPWNWLNSQAQVDRLATLFETYLNAGRLVDLPDAGPDFIFCASDNAFAVNWIFSRSRIGDYQAGYRAPGPWTIGRAAAASSCFPPVFDPMKARAQPSELIGGRYSSGLARDALIRGLRLSDGGLYDNLALEPIWKHHAVVIASDGGGTFDPGPDAGLMKRLKRYATIMGRQATALRKRWLIASFSTGVMTGAYLGIGTPVSRYGEGFLGYSPGTVVDFIAEVRTDLDRFSEGEIAVLQNHGYLVAEAALKTHLAATPLAIIDAPLAIPYPDWMDEARVRNALADSAKTNLPFGRGPWIRYVL